MQQQQLPPKSRLTSHIAAHRQPVSAVAGIMEKQQRILARDGGVQTSGFICPQSNLAVLLINDA